MIGTYKGSSACSPDTTSRASGRPRGSRVAIMALICRSVGSSLLCPNCHRLSSPPSRYPDTVVASTRIGCSSKSYTRDPLLSQLLFNRLPAGRIRDRKSTRLNSSHTVTSYAVFCLKKKNKDALNALLLQIECKARLERIDPKLPVTIRSAGRAALVSSTQTSSAEQLKRAEGRLIPA